MGQPIYPTTESILFWFSTLEALATIKTMVSLHLLLYQISTRLHARKRFGTRTTLLNREIQTAGKIRFLPIVSLLNVKVPVLSLQSTSMYASPSIAAILFVIGSYNNEK